MRRNFIENTTQQANQDSFLSPQPLHYRRSGDYVERAVPYLPLHSNADKAQDFAYPIHSAASEYELDRFDNYDLKNKPVDESVESLGHGGYNRSDANIPLIPPDRKNEANNLQGQIYPQNFKLHPSRRPLYERLPYFTIVVTLIQLAVFIAELAKQGTLVGTPFPKKPFFNPMIGPTNYLMVNMGARYVPCMRPVHGITNDANIQYPCPNSTSEDGSCTLDQLCGLGGVPVNDNLYQPNQWYRIVTPIFLHAGIIHILFNLILQLTMGSIVESSVGFIKYAIIYMSSGISGFLLGANFAPPGMASTGASGALFGMLATNFLLFIFSGKRNLDIYGIGRFWAYIFVMVGEVIISFVLGLLPGLDNFSHIGGFAIGMLVSLVLLPDPFMVYKDGLVPKQRKSCFPQRFLNNWNPVYHMDKKIKYRYFIWCCVRIISIVLIILYFYLLAKNFFNSNDELPQAKCSWCKYLNCIPVHDWCDMGQLQVDNKSK